MNRIKGAKCFEICVKAAHIFHTNQVYSAFSANVITSFLHLNVIKNGSDVSVINSK